MTLMVSFNYKIFVFLFLGNLLQLFFNNTNGSTASSSDQKIVQKEDNNHKQSTHYSRGTSTFASSSLMRSDGGGDGDGPTRGISFQFHRLQMLGGSDIGSGITVGERLQALKYDGSLLVRVWIGDNCVRETELVDTFAVDDTFRMGLMENVATFPFYFSGSSTPSSTPPSITKNINDSNRKDKLRGSPLRSNPLKSPARSPKISQKVDHSKSPQSKSSSDKGKKAASKSQRSSGTRHSTASSSSSYSQLNRAFWRIMEKLASGGVQELESEHPRLILELAELTDDQNNNDDQELKSLFCVDVVEATKGGLIDVYSWQIYAEEDSVSILAVVPDSALSPC